LRHLPFKTWWTSVASILVEPPCRSHAPVVASRSQRSYPAAGIFHSSSSRRTRGAASSSSRRTCSAATLIQRLRHGNSQPAARIQTPANQGQRHQQLSIQRRGVANVVAEATVLFRDANNCDKWSVAAGPRCARCVINRVSRCERDRPASASSRSCAARQGLAHLGWVD
jgi:hypothetical protein